MAQNADVTALPTTIPTNLIPLRQGSTNIPMQAGPAGVPAFGTLPTRAAENANLGKDDIQSMGALLGGGITDADVKAALTPTMQRGGIGLPPSLTRPIQPFQPAPLDQRAVIGAGNARARGIGNAITGAMNVVGSFVNARAQQTQDQHAQSVSRFLMAQSNADQAKSMMEQIGEGNPGYEQAKSTFESNTALQKKMFEDDPKFAKVLEKGMNISLTDPSKNKTPEHQSFMQGLNIFRRNQAQQQRPDSGAMLQRFQQQMPMGLGPNQYAQNLLNYKMMQQQQLNKFYQSMIPRIYSAQKADERAQNQIVARQQLQNQNHIFESWKLGQQDANNINLANMRHNFKLNEIDREQAALGNRMLDLFNAEKYSPAEMFKLKSDQEKFFMNSESKYASAIEAVNRTLASEYAMSKPNQDNITRYQQQLNSLNQQMNNFQTYKNDWYKSYSGMTDLFAGGTSNAGTANAAAPGQPPSFSTVPATGGTTSPETLLNNQPWQYGGGTPATGITPSITIPPAAAGTVANPTEDEDDEATAGGEP